MDLPTALSKVVRYNREGFLAAIDREPHELTHRKVFADWLEENDPTASPVVVDRLRNYEEPLWVGLSPKGAVNAIPRVTQDVLLSRAARLIGDTGITVHDRVPTGDFYHATSRNSKGQAHRVRASGKMKLWARRPGEFRVPWKFGLYDNGEFNHRNSSDWLIEDPTTEPPRS